MSNVFHRLEQMFSDASINQDEISRALLVAVYLACCDECSMKLRSEEFRQDLEKILKDIRTCRDLSSKTAA